MTRPTPLLRALAAIAVGGSLLAAAPLPAEAPEEPETPVAGPAILSIAPLRVELEGAGTGATIRLTNASNRALPVQARLFAWSQTNGEDVYAPSSELVVSPSIASIPAGQTQVVRVLRRGAASPGEKRFRLAVDQLPDPALVRPGTAQTRIRFTLPVFVDREKAPPAAFAWRIANDRIEPQELDVAFVRPPDETVRVALNELFQAALDRATR